MRSVSTLIITSKVPCVIKHGDCFCSVEDGMPLVIPASGDGEQRFTVWSTETDRGLPVPRLVSITLEDGKAVRANTPVIDWDGVIEAEAEPCFVKQTGNLRPELLDSGDFVYMGEPVRAELFYAGGLELNYTLRNGRKYSFWLGDGSGGRLRVLDVGSARLLSVLAKADDSERLIILDGEARILLDETAENADILDGYPTVYEKLSSVRGLLRRTRFEYLGGEFKAQAKEIGFFDGAERIPSSNEEKALSIAEEIGYGTDIRFFELVSEELRADGVLKDFLGDFTEARLCPVNEGDSRITIGLLKGEGVIRKPRRFVFVMKDGILTDVEEL